MFKCLLLPAGRNVNVLFAVHLQFQIVSAMFNVKISLLLIFFCDSIFCEIFSAIEELESLVRDEKLIIEELENLVEDVNDDYLTRFG